jgi:putative transposase
MLEKDRESIALFRYGLIAPLLNGQVESRKDYLAEICSQIHQVPCRGSKEYRPKTVEKWLRTYQKEGFDGLKPKQRSDKGQTRKVPLELKVSILEFREQRRDLPVSMFYSLLVQKGIIKKCDFSYSTIYRFLKKHNLLCKENRIELERKRFAYDQVNILWQTDLWHGPYLKEGSKKRATYLIAFIDDCSRIIPAASFSFTEKTEDLMRVFEEALLRRGLPKMLYADNGKIFRSNQFQLACASLGISLIHTKPYDPAAKGKIERFFGNVSRRFMPLFRHEQISGLDELNTFFWQWLEKEYHRKEHSALGMSPLDLYLSQMSRVKMVGDPAALRVLFLKREYRKVRHDGTISLKGHLFEVPALFIGQRVELRHDEELKQVDIFEQGRKVAEAKAVNFADNALVKREKPVLSFAELLQEGDE